MVEWLNAYTASPEQYPLPLTLVNGQEMVKWLNG